MEVTLHTIAALKAVENIRTRLEGMGGAAFRHQELEGIQEAETSCRIGQHVQCMTSRTSFLCEFSIPLRILRSGSHHTHHNKFEDFQGNGSSPFRQHAPWERLARCQKLFSVGVKSPCGQCLLPLEPNLDLTDLLLADLYS